MNTNDFRDIVKTHITRYPDMQPQDLYKLAHQAALGSEHAIEDTHTARRWLKQEVERLPADSVEPMIDVISPDQRLVRVHLKPYIVSGGNLQDLLEAFIRTANEHQGSTKLFKQYWASIEAIAQSGGLPFAPEDLRTIMMHMESRGFPAVHHSTQYVAAYSPGYRVVLYHLLAQGNQNNYQPS